MKPFDFVNAINESKQDLIKEDPLCERDYSPFLVNRAFSFYPDTIMYANEMNRYSDLPKEWQFQFLLNTITKKKRYSKWHKRDAYSKSLLLVKEYFGYSSEKAKEALRTLSKEQLKEIEQKLEKGGKREH